MNTSGIGIGNNGQVSLLGQAQGTDQVPPQPPTTQSADEATDQTSLSQGSQLMGELKNLQSSDPKKFKAVAQKISDNLAEAAKNSADPQQGKMLGALSGKFSEAAKSGNMNDLHFQHHGHSGHGKRSGAMGQAYAGQPNPGAMFSEVNGIISNALTSAGGSTSATSSAGATTTTVSTADETAA